MLIERLIPFFFVGVLHSAPAVNAVLRADSIEEPGKTFAISFSRGVTSGVRVPIAFCQMREFLLDERQISFTRSRAQSERARADVSRASFTHFLHERLEIRRIIGYAWENGHAVDTRIDPCFAKSPERPHSRFRRRRARLESSREIPAKSDQREMDMKIGDPVDAGKQVDVACDERTFRYDADLESGMLGKNLEDSPGYPEPSLGRLVRIGRSSDDDGLTFEKR